MSQKKIKRNKGSIKDSKKKIIDLDIQGGEGFYGVVEKVFGDKYVSVKLNDGTLKDAKIPGKFWKKVWVKNGTKVMINNEMEIVQIIRDSDVRFAEAERMLRNTSGDDYNMFSNYSDQSDDEDNKETNQSTQSIQDIKKVDNIGKTKELLARKEKEKNKDMERRGGRVIRDADEIEKDMSEYNSTKIKNPSEEVNMDDIDIDKI